MREREGMMLDINCDIDSLSSFKRNTADFLRRLRETGSPIILTVDGKPEFVVQDAESYQRLLRLVERLEEIRAVQEGLASMKRGAGRPMDAVFDDLQSELKAEPRTR